MPRDRPERAAAPPATPPREARSTPRNMRWHYWLAAAVAIVAFALLLQDTQTTLTGIWSTLIRDPSRVGLGATLAITLTLILPLIVGAAAGYLAWQSARLLQLAAYLRTVHSATGSLLREAQLARLGYAARGVPFAASGLPGSEVVKLATLMSRARGLLLLGDDGYGKSFALAEHAHALSRGDGVLPIALGRRPLPILLPLEWFARCDLERDDALAAGVAEQLRVFGGGQLASRSVRALPHWKFVLLCDGLEEVPRARRKAVADHLSALLGEAYAEARLVVTSSLSAYLAEAPQLTTLQTLERVVLRSAPAEDASRLLRQAGRSPRARNLAARYGDSATASRSLGRQVSHPATLAMLVSVLEADEAPPPGRGHLLRTYANVQCARAGDEGEAARLRALLESLAGALRANDVAAIPLDAGKSAGEVVGAWLERTAEPQGQDEGALGPLVETALRSGLLQQPRGAGCVRFVSRSAEAVFAALALERLDGLGPEQRLPPDLVEPRWHEPVLLWAGFASDPSRLPGRLLALAPSASASASVVPALALAAALEAYAPTLADPPSAWDSHLRDAVDIALRQIFDEVARRTYGAEARQALIQELAAIERDSQVDLTGHLVTVARCAMLGRIVRAQAIELLGGLISPTSLDGLVALLPEPDVVLRGAVDRAFALAGPLAAPRLQRALGSEDERVRLRAVEALGQHRAAGITSIVSATTGEGALERETAARALGVLKATEAVPALVTLLDDRNEVVRLAAIEALGQMRTEEASAALMARAGAAQANVRAAIAAALGEARDVVAIDSLLAMLEDSAAPVRTAAAEALGKLGDERAVRPLRERLADSDPWAQAAAATALRRLGDR
jgi:hypothetical protein